MLAELLLVLSGHPSAFFIPYPHPVSSQTSIQVSPTLAEHLHPGEVSSLNTLGELAFRYTKIRRWALNVQQAGRVAILRQSAHGEKEKGKGKGKSTSVGEEGPSQYLTTLAGGILEVLIDYTLLIVTTEARILDMDTELVQDHQGYVPLSSLTATFSKWQAPLASLSNLVDIISSPPKVSQPSTSTSVTFNGKDKLWTSGEIIHLIHEQTQSGNPHLQEIYTSLLKPLRHLFLTHLTSFLLYGLSSPISTPTSPSLGLDIGPDPLSPQHRIYALNDDLLPSSIRQETRESVLYVGRVAATLRREGRGLPASVVEELRGVIMGVSGLEDEGGLDEAIQEARADVGEWLWRHILTGPQIAEALEAFGNFFLTRNADYSIQVIREITRLRLNKIITSNPQSSSSVIRDQDLNLVLLRASVGTSAETDHFLDHLRFKLEKGPLRPLLPSFTVSSRRKEVENPYKEEGSVRDLFSSFLLGTPLIMTTSISWPLDLFMTPPAISAYIDINTYLLAIRETHLKVLESWTSLSASQRRRRKWTGSNEGGTPDEVISRRNLARSSWGLVRSMLFFLDQLQSHFMTDIIDVQHRHLLGQLETVTTLPQSTSMGSLGHSHLGSLRGGAKFGSPVNTISKGRMIRPGSPMSEMRPGSPGSSTHGDGQTGRSRTGPPPTKPPQNYLDFLTLRQMHARHLSFLREGLLLTDMTFAIIIRDILDTYKRFVGLVEIWGGDVLPELLEGGGDGDSDLVKERSQKVKDVSQQLHELYSDFFKALLDSQNPTSNADASSAAAGTGGGGISFSKTSRAQFLRQTSFTASTIGSKLKGKNKAEMEKEERNLEAETVMGRHVEQLLLRLDFNGVLTDWTTEDDEVTANLLAQGGL